MYWRNSIALGLGQLGIDRPDFQKIAFFSPIYTRHN